MEQRLIIVRQLYWPSQDVWCKTHCDVLNDGRRDLPYPLLYPI